MSMPSFPTNGANMSREQALTMIVASIALEERALSRIIDAEGDKLQYILDQCRETCGSRRASKDVLAVNRSVTELLDVVAQNQMILCKKLDLALEAGGGCPPLPCPLPPCEPSCTPKPPLCTQSEQRSLIQLRVSGSSFLWKNECLIPWEYAGGRGNAMCWSREEPSLVKLEREKAYFVNCTFLLSPMTSGRICLESEAREIAPPLYFSARCGGNGEGVTLPYTAMLLPGSASTVSFRLRSRMALCVKQAELNIMEL